MLNLFNLGLKSSKLLTQQDEELRPEEVNSTKSSLAKSNFPTRLDYPHPIPFSAFPPPRISQWLTSLQLLPLSSLIKVIRTRDPSSRTIIDLPGYDQNSGSKRLRTKQKSGA